MLHFFPPRALITDAQIDSHLGCLAVKLTISYSSDFSRPVVVLPPVCCMIAVRPCLRLSACLSVCPSAHASISM